jgi:hypothetical protein
MAGRSPGVEAPLRTRDAEYSKRGIRALDRGRPGGCIEADGLMQRPSGYILYLLVY